MRCNISASLLKRKSMLLRPKGGHGAVRYLGLISCLKCFFQRYVCVLVFPIVACQDPLGMESHELSDDEITASDWKTGYNAYKARLNNYAGWMVYNDFSMAHFIQVELGSDDFTLTGVATQGIYGYLVKTFTLSYSLDGIDWFEYRENGQVKVRRC